MVEGKLSQRFEKLAHYDIFIDGFELNVGENISCLLLWNELKSFGLDVNTMLHHNKVGHFWIALAGDALDLDHNLPLISRFISKQSSPS